MPTILETTSKPGTGRRYLHEITFSVYVSLLLILADDVSSKWVNNPGDRIPWVLRMKFLLTGDYRTHSLVADPKLRFAFVFLWAVLALGIFLLLRTARRPSARTFLRTGAGIVTVAGFPLIFAYGFHNILVLILLVETAAAVICVLIFVDRQWPRSVPWAISLALLHFGFWSWCTWNGHYFSPGWVGGVPLFWPGYTLTWLTVEDPVLIYPWLGFLTTLAWGLYIRQPAESPRHAGI